jgi:hypothetical protein
MGEKMTVEELLENEELIKMMVEEMVDKSSMRYGHVENTDSEYVNSIKKSVMDGHAGIEKRYAVDLPYPNPINRHQRRTNNAHWDRK